MTIGARTAAWSGEKLPYLRRVEYLTFNGLEYINTGFTDYENAFITFDGALNASINDSQFFGIDDTSFTKCYCDYFNGKIWCGFGGIEANISWNFTTEKLRIVIDFAARKAYLNGNELYNSLSWTGVSDYPLLIGKRYGGQLLQGRVYGMAMEGDSVKMDMIPVVALFNGVEEGCMYDRVSKQLFRNAGTGAFTWGELA